MDFFKHTRTKKHEHHVPRVSIKAELNDCDTTCPGSIRGWTTHKNHLSAHSLLSLTGWTSNGLANCMLDSIPTLWGFHRDPSKWRPSKAEMTLLDSTALLNSQTVCVTSLHGTHLSTGQQFLTKHSTAQGGNNTK